MLSMSYWLFIVIFVINTLRDGIDLCGPRWMLMLCPLFYVLDLTKMYSLFDNVCKLE